MTKNEIKHLANKIIEDGLSDCWEFNIIIDIQEYGNLNPYKNKILEYINKDERVADAEFDNDGNISIVFYTDFCPNYEEDEEEI